MLDSLLGVLPIHRLIVDAIGPIARLRRLLRAAFPGIAEIIVEAKADSTYPVVAAASIMAKHTRDRNHLQHTYGEETAETRSVIDSCGPRGSGYPGDEDTQKWIEQLSTKFHTLPSTIRRSWMPMQQMLRVRAEQSELPEDQGQVPLPDDMDHLRTKLLEVRRLQRGDVRAAHRFLAAGIEEHAADAGVAETDSGDSSSSDPDEDTVLGERNKSAQHSGQRTRSSAT
jgi:hypothetical protein